MPTADDILTNVFSYNAQPFVVIASSITDTTTNVYTYNAQPFVSKATDPTAGTRVQLIYPFFG